MMKGTLQDRMLPVNPDGGFRMEDYWVWCGSVIKGEDGTYHMFASRWRKELPMHPGWLVGSEIVHAVSHVPEGPYQFQNVALGARGAEFWDGRSVHNPHIMKFGDTYVLYYMGTTHPFPELGNGEILDLDNCRTITARANKRIGIATSKCLDGPWERRDAPILSPRPRFFDNFFVSNPAPCETENGEILMLYKSRSYVKPPYPKYLHGKMQFGIAKAKVFDGKYIPQSDVPMFSSDEIHMEDPFIWRDQDGYNMMAKDMNGAVCGERLGGIHAISRDGVSWKIEFGKTFYSKTLTFEDGSVRTLGNMERPFLLFEGNKPACAFFAVSDGTGDGFTNCKNTWNMAVKLK